VVVEDRAGGRLPPVLACAIDHRTGAPLIANRTFGAPLTQPTTAEARSAALAMLPPAGPVLRGTPVRHAPAVVPRSSCGRHHAVI